jgi:DNA invertase Pin-like site-specific DNA recombinase/ribosomal protein L37E
MSNKCVIWARVSSREQREGYSIDAQLRITRERAQREGWEIVREFVVAESAKRGAERVTFNHMVRWVLANAKRHNIDYILAHKLDRICRNMKDAVRMQEIEDKHGIKLAFVDNQFGTGAAGALSFNIMAAVAQYYSDNLRQEVLKGIEERVRQGWTSGLAAYGYMNVPTDKERPIHPHPEKCKAVRRIFELYATGTMTFEQVADVLNREGFVYRPSVPRFSRTAISYILNNPYYTGLVRLRDELFVGKHEPIIDQDTFDQCQALLKRKNRRSNKVNHYLASGMFICAHCGYGITSERIRRKNKNGKVREYVYYRCGNVYPDTDHPKLRWRQEDLEEAILTDLRSIRIQDDKERQWFRDSIIAAFQDDTLLRAERAKSLKRRVSDLEKMQQRLLDAYLAGGLDQKTFTTKTSQFKDQIAQARMDIQTSKAAPLTGFEQVLEVFDLAQEAAKRWETGDHAARRDLLDAILLNRSLSATSLVTTKRKPFDLLAEGLVLKKSRHSLSGFERIPLEFLYWFLETSLQHDAIEELMENWKSGAFFIGSGDDD